MLKTLHTFLPIARKVHNRRTKLPVLNHCLVDSGFIRMTDLETTVRMPIDDIRAYTLPVQVLYQVLKTKPESFDVHLSDETPGQLQIVYGGNTLTCPTIDPDEYPGLDLVPFQELGTWLPETFQVMKAQTQYASTDDLKPALNGVWIQQNGELETCSTDGHMLKYYPTLQADELTENGKDYSGILPTKTVKILARFAKGPVQVQGSEDYMKFTLPNKVEIIVRKIDERFPDFKPLLDIDTPNTLQVAKQPLLDAIQSAKPFTNKSTYQGVVKMREQDIHLIAEDPEKDVRFDTDVPVKQRDGDRIPMGFNLLYFERLLKSMEDETVEWRYKSPISASLFTEPTRNGDSPISLLMPIRLDEGQPLEKGESDETNGHD